MSSWLLIIFSVVLWMISEGFPSKFLKCSFHFWCLSSWLVALVLLSRCFSFYFLHLLSVMWIMIVFFLTNFWFYWFDLECILVILFSMLVAFVGFLLSRDAFFTSSRLSLTAIVSQWTLYLAFGLVGIYSAAAFIWVVTKFSYSSFGVCLSDDSWRVSNLFLTVGVYWLLISLLANSLVWFYGISKIVDILIPNPSLYI